MTAAQKAKAIAALITTLVGAAGEAITAGLVVGNTAKWVEMGIGVVTAAGSYLAVYFTTNAPAPVPPAPVTVPPLPPPVTHPPGA